MCAHHCSEPSLSYSGTICTWKWTAIDYNAEFVMHFSAAHSLLRGGDRGGVCNRCFLGSNVDSGGLKEIKITEVETNGPFALEGGR